jgi:hypothetical protein
MMLQMRVPLADLAQLKSILRDVETTFAALPLFRAGRREIVAAFALHALRCTKAMRDLGWLAGPDLKKGSDTLVRLDRVFREILRTMVTVPPGKGPPADGVSNDFETALLVATVARPLRSMVDGGAWGTAEFDPVTREFLFAAQDSEIQARDSFNAARLRQAEAERLDKGMQRIISADAEPGDVHANDVERLNSKYTQETFRKVRKALRAAIIELARSDADELCKLQETDREQLVRDLAQRSGVAQHDVDVVVSDLIFNFQRQDDNGLLLEIDPGRLLIFPLAITLRSHDAQDYISVSKSRYQSEYGAYQRALTKALEDRVGAALRMHAPQAEVRALPLPGNLGEIDRITSDPDEDALVLVQVKYLLDYDNTPVAHGIKQLDRDERVIRAEWPEISKMLRGWKGRPFPAHVRKMLVTNWFLGTIEIPKDVRVVSVQALQEMPLAGGVRPLAERIFSLPEQLVAPKQENVIKLFGYTFIYYTAQD